MSTTRLPRPGFPLALLAAGAMGEIVLEFIAWWIAPAVLGMPMRPDILVSALASSLLGLSISTTLAVSVHLLAGLVLFPLAYVLARRAAGTDAVLVPALLTGLALWALAQMILAPLAGRPFMLGFVPYTWGSLVAHVVYMLAVAWALERLAGDTQF